MLELVHDAHAQKAAFADACAWAEDIHLCMAWLEPGDAHGPSFADLEPHQGKLRHAIVGLTRFQSYPALLRRLYRANALRLVSSLDGSFSPNCYVFRRASRVRVIVASAPFTATHFGRPCESFVVFEGERDDPFALRAVELLAKCQAHAHVPTSSELDAYEAAWADARTDQRLPHAVAGLHLEPLDGGALGALSLVHDDREKLEAFVEVRDALAQSAAVRSSATILPHHGREPGAEPVNGILYWSSLGAWSALVRDATHFGLHVGFVPPWEVERPIAALSLRASHAANGEAASGTGATMHIARSPDGRRFVVHPTGASDPFDVLVGDGAEQLRVLLVGEVGSADFIRTASALARRIARRRATSDDNMDQEGT